MCSFVLSFNEKTFVNSEKSELTPISGGKFFMEEKVLAIYQARLQILESYSMQWTKFE